MKRVEFFNRVATSDDPMPMPPDMAERVEAVRRNLGTLAGLHILEPGCGTGAMTKCLLDWSAPDGHITAFDNSPGMLERARHKLAAENRVVFDLADVETFSPQPEAYDLILIFRLFPHIDRKLETLQQLRAGLKSPAGRLVIANLECSQNLNTFHQGCSDGVQHDRMPCVKGTTALLDCAGYSVQRAVEQDDLFYVEAHSTPVAVRLPARK